MKDIFTPLQIEALAETFADLMAEVDRRIAAQPSVHHAGTWKEGAFKGGALVTDKGSLWLAKRATTARPGQSDAWQLVVATQQTALSTSASRRCADDGHPSRERPRR